MTSSIRNVSSIVEQGRDGVWLYRKFSDGTAECWSYKSVNNVSITTQYGNAYYGAERTSNFPSGLFASAPTPIIHVYSSSGTWAGASDWSKTSYSYYPFSPTSGTFNLYETCYAVGTWK